MIARKTVQKDFCTLEPTLHTTVLSDLHTRLQIFLNVTTRIWLIGIAKAIRQMKRHITDL